MQAKLNFHRFGIGLVALLISLGLLFRLANLDDKVFWVDEAATAIRIAGYTRTEVTAQLADGRPRTPADLLAYQQLQPDRSLPHLTQALKNSPEHAPLYFLLLRGWTGLWGSSVVALRSFSVLCSLLALPAIYWLSQQLFQSNPASWIAVSLMAISPFFVAYAQEARPYSLWTLLLMVNSATLLRALQRNTRWSWGWYGLTLAMSLYTSLLTLGVTVGQLIFVLIRYPLRSVQTRRFGWTVLAAMVALLPWIILMAQRWQTLQHNTTWMRLPLEPFVRPVIWFYTTAILYFDVPVVLQPGWLAATEIILATIVVGLISYSFYSLWRYTRSSIKLFVLTLALPLPFLLILLDLFTDGRYSTAPRYLLPFHLAIQLTVAFWLAHGWEKISFSKSTQIIVAFLLTLCLISNLIHWNTSPRYLKNRNLHNLPIAQSINQLEQPLVLSESINTMDLLALSHALNPDVQIQVLPVNPTLASWLASPAVECRAVLLFNPSPALLQQVRSHFVEVYHPPLLLPGEFALTLWQLQSKPCSPSAL